MGEAFDFRRMTGVEASELALCKHDQEVGGGSHQYQGDTSSIHKQDRHVHV